MNERTNERTSEWVANLYSSQLDVVQNHPDGPVSDEPQVRVKAKESIGRPGRIDAQGNALPKQFKKPRSQGHHVQTQPQPPVSKDKRNTTVAKLFLWLSFYLAHAHIHNERQCCKTIISTCAFS